MNKILTVFVLILAVSAVGLELFNIHFASKLASDSVSVKKLQASIAALDEENQILNSQVLDQTSFESISKKATLLGFVSNQSYISLRTQVKLSYNQ